MQNTIRGGANRSGHYNQPSGLLDLEQSPTAQASPSLTESAKKHPDSPATHIAGVMSGAGEESGALVVGVIQTPVMLYRLHEFQSKLTPMAILMDPEGAGEASNQAITTARTMIEHSPELVQSLFLGSAPEKFRAGKPDQAIGAAAVSLATIAVPEKWLGVPKVFKQTGMMSKEAGMAVHGEAAVRHSVELASAKNEVTIFDATKADASAVGKAGNSEQLLTEISRKLSVLNETVKSGTEVNYKFNAFVIPMKDKNGQLVDLGYRYWDFGSDGLNSMAYLTKTAVNWVSERAGMGRPLTFKVNVPADMIPLEKQVEETWKDVVRVRVKEGGMTEDGENWTGWGVTSAGVPPLNFQRDMYNTGNGLLRLFRPDWRQKYVEITLRKQ